MYENIIAIILVSCLIVEIMLGDSNGDDDISSSKKKEERQSKLDKKNENKRNLQNEGLNKQITKVISIHTDKLTYK